MTRHMGRRQQVLEALRGTKEPKTVTQLARGLRVHGNTVRFHLDSLLNDGLIEIAKDDEADRPVGRPAVRYTAVARVAPSHMKHTETLVKLFLTDLRDDPQGRERAEEIGRRWGSKQADQTTVEGCPSGLNEDVHALTTLLSDMGFESDPPTNRDVLVKSCPFLDDVDPEELKARAENEELPVVCAVHLGVMKGALDSWEADTDVQKLVPFARADRCHIALTAKR